MSQPDSPPAYLSRKAIAALAAIEQLGYDGYCDHTQQAIAAAAGMSTRHLRRAIRELEQKGRLSTRQRYLVGHRCTKNVYQVIHRRPDKKSPVTPPINRVTGQKESDHSRVTGQKESAMGGQKESAMSHELMNDSENNKEGVGNLLHWIDNPKRRKLLGLDHMTPEYARRFTTYYYQGIYPAHVDPDHIVGYLIRIMENGDDPPPAQLELPAGVLPFTSRGKSASEIEEEHPVARHGGHLDEESGYWR